MVNSVILRERGRVLRRHRLRRAAGSSAWPRSPGPPACRGTRGRPGPPRACRAGRRPCPRPRPAARPGSTARARRSRTCPGPARLTARKASFSQASSTSPMPRCTKVVVEPRAPESSTGTFVKSCVTKAARVGLVAARLLQRVAPGRQVVPARAARGLGVGRDHRDAGLHQVVPVLDALGVALAHQEHDGRGVGRAVVRQPLLPVRRQQPGLGDGVDVVGQRQRDHVGLQPVDDRARLLARAAVRLLDGHVLARSSPSSASAKAALNSWYSSRVGS